MADFLKKLRSLNTGEPSDTCKISLSSPWQATTDQRTKFDQESGTPIVAPLDTVEEVLSWVSGCDELCVASVPLQHQQGTSYLMDDPLTQKMIICHDMMGGYVKDKFPQGVRDMEDYYFYHWRHIGAFIYFSHHFITIPPPSWTNAAHRHGVLSMGTLITEWEAGARLCHSLLQDDFKVTQFAQQLVQIAYYYRFDGWLINIENPIHPMLLEKVYMLISLVTTGMHDFCPGSKVIWYDSITTEGKLKWQNMLNHLNQPYFDLCDGIFLNYNWTESGLSASRALAKERNGEVYVGIDVFGRGCPGGGGYNSSEALKIIHSSGLSSALFAPGWVFENQNKQFFFRNQNKFWSLLQPWLHTTPVSSLPLVTSFGRGCGNILAIDGKVVYSGPWANHSAQDLQPSFCTESCIQNDSQSAVVLEQVTLDLTTAYNNGASLKVEGKANSVTRTLSKPALLRLFMTNVELSRPLVVAYTYKIDNGDAASPNSSPVHRGYRSFLQLHTSGSPSRIFLDPFSSVGKEAEEESAILRECGLPRSQQVPSLPGCVLAPVSPCHSRALHQIYTGGEEQDSTWITCYFVVDREELKDKCINEITVGFYSVPTPPTSSSSSEDKHNTTSRFSFNIGEIKVLDSRCLSPHSKMSSVSNIWCHDIKVSSDGQRASLTLSWQAVDSPRDPIDHCNIYLSSIISEKSRETDIPWKSERAFLGRSYVKSFRVSELYLLVSKDSENSVVFEFCVQPVTASRCKPPAGHCLVTIES